MADKFLSGIHAAQTDVSMPVILRGTSDNEETTAVGHGSVSASYWRQGGTRTAVSTSALGSVDAAHSDGGWIEVSSSNMPGVYRFDLPDAACAAGADWVMVTIVVSGSFTFNQLFPLQTTERIADAILDLENGAETVGGGITVRQALRLMLSSLVGEMTKSGDELTFKAAGHNTTTRIVGTGDATGQRSDVTLSP